MSTTEIIASTEVTILTFNDIYDFNPDHEGLGGLSELQTIIEKEKSKEKNVITCLNGDFLEVSSLASIYKGSHMIDIFNEMSIDYVCLGNHEFDHGEEELKKRIKESKFKWINSNIHENQKVLEGTKEYEILTFDKIKIGMFSLCTEETRNISYPGESIEFLDCTSTTEKMLKIFEKEKIDVIIGITHLALKFDIELAKKFPSINVIIGGHDHNPISVQQGNTLIMKSGHDAHYLGNIKLNIKKTKHSFQKNDYVHTRVIPDWKFILNQKGTNKENMKVKERIQHYMQFLPEDEDFAICESFLDSTTETVRGKEAVFGNLVCDAVLFNYQSEIAFVNGGTIRGDRHYAPGHVITKSDLNIELPFINPCYECKILGKDLLQLFEESMNKVGTRHGSFPHFSKGISLTFDLKNEVGSRLIKSSFNGEPIDENRWYSLVSTKYLLSGGDSYLSLKNGISVTNNSDGTIVRDSVEKYLKHEKVVSPKIEGRIHLIH